MNINNIININISLIAKIKNGDSEAFKLFIENNFNKSKHLIQKQYHISQFDLDDIMQITSIKVWKYINNLKDIEQSYNWFFSIFKNEAVRYLYERNNIEKNEISSNCSLTDDDQILIYVHSLDEILNETAKTFLEKKEDIEEYKKIIIQILSTLKKKHKDIIELILIKEKSYKEAADILNLPVGSIMSRLFYAKKEAQKIINEYSRNNEFELTILR